MQLIQQLTYRPYHYQDLPGILSLWENYSGWGSITEQQFNDWYVKTPFGACPIVVAENESGEIIGQLTFIPVTIWLDGKQIKALRLSAPILHNDFRLQELRSMEHPAFLMIRHGMNMAKELGYEMVYSLPAHGWLGLLKMFPRFGLPDIKTASYDCVSVSLTDNKIVTEFSRSDVDITVIDHFDESFDELWKEACISFPIDCGIVRTSSLLNWKKSNHLILKVTKKEKLMGYAMYKKKDGLLMDILARTTFELKDVLLSTVKAIHRNNHNHLPVDFEEIKIMCSPQLEPIITHLATVPVNFQFAFGCYPLTPVANIDSILPGNWYLMPND